jgi:autonomous glycyl radical cofactor GrcA
VKKAIIMRTILLAVCASCLSLLGACSRGQDGSQFDQSTQQNDLENFRISNPADYKFYLNGMDFLEFDNLVRLDPGQTSHFTQNLRPNDQFYCLLSYSQPYEIIRALDERKNIQLERYVAPDTAAKIRVYRTPFRYGQIEIREILVVSDTDFKILKFNQHDSQDQVRGITLNDQVDDGCIYAQNSQIRVSQNVIDFSGLRVR